MSAAIAVSVSDHRHAVADALDFDVAQRHERSHARALLPDPLHAHAAPLRAAAPLDRHFLALCGINLVALDAQDGAERMP